MKTLRDSFNDLCIAAQKIDNSPKYHNVRAIDILQLDDDSLLYFDNERVCVLGSFDQITELENRLKLIYEKSKLNNWL